METIQTARQPDSVVVAEVEEVLLAECHAPSGGASLCLISYWRLQTACRQSSVVFVETEGCAC